MDESSHNFPVNCEDNGERKKPAEVTEQHHHTSIPESADDALNKQQTLHDNIRISTDSSSSSPPQWAVGEKSAEIEFASATLPQHEAGEKRKITETEEEKAAKRQKLIAAQAIAAEKRVNNEQWEAMYKRLIAYKEQQGDCLVPKRYSADPRLGTWVETQRVQYKRLQRGKCEKSGSEKVQPNKRLSEERLAKLEAIGFAWTAKSPKKKDTEEGSSPEAPKVENVATTKKPPPPEGPRANASKKLNDSEQWENFYQRLVFYKSLYGDTMVPRKYEADPKLATWVETQRVLWNREYRETNAEAGRSNSSFTLSETNLIQEDSKADRRHSMPEQQIEEEGTSSVFSNPTYSVKGVAENYYEQQREEVAMGPEDIIKRSLSMNAWNDNGENGGAHSSKLIIPASKRLSKERKERLDALGFVWSLRNKRIEDHWDEMFRQLVDYKEKHGDCLVPSRYLPNLKLGKWVETQRYEYTKLQRAAGDDVKSEGMESLEASKARITNPRLTEERLRRLESIGFEWKVKHKMKRFYDKQWDQMFERLLQFKQENGHCMVPKRYPPDIKLGTWVHTQRIQYRKMNNAAKGIPEKVSDRMSDDGSNAGDEYSKELAKLEEDGISRLTDERRQRLESIGFIWSAREAEKGLDQSRITRNSYDDQWDVMFDRLKAFKEKHGHCLVPKRSKEDPKLGTWVDTQRVQYKKMKKKLESLGIDSADRRVKSDASTSAKPIVGRLTDERIQRLEDLGFVWSLRDDWQKHYHELKEYKNRHGHCNVPARFPENRRLGIWVSAQRQQYKIMKGEANAGRKPGPLTQDRINLLNDIGFTWTIRSRDSCGEGWNQRFQDLQEYKCKYGNCLVPSRYPPNPELGVWVGTQRTQYRIYLKAKEEGRPISTVTSINEERIRQLEELGFVWALRGQETFKKETDMPNVNANNSESQRNVVPNQNPDSSATRTNTNPSPLESTGSWDYLTASATSGSGGAFVGKDKEVETSTRISEDEFHYRSNVRSREHTNNGLANLLNNFDPNTVSDQYPAQINLGSAPFVSQDISTEGSFGHAMPTSSDGEDGAVLYNNNTDTHQNFATTVPGMIAPTESNMNHISYKPVPVYTENNAAEIDGAETRSKSAVQSASTSLQYESFQHDSSSAFDQTSNQEEERYESHV